MPIAVMDDDDAIQYASSSNVGDVDNSNDLPLIIGLHVILGDISSKTCLHHEILSLGCREDRNVVVAIKMTCFSLMLVT